MANFTKGPWIVQRIAAFAYTIATEGRGVIVREVRSEDNAQLIAAAPELFECLEALLEVTPFARDSKERGLHLRCEAAIQKAVCRG